MAGDEDSRVVTGEMVGLFFVLAFDLLVVVGVLWYVGQLSSEVAGFVFAGTIAVFLGWICYRWWSIRRSRVTGLDEDTTVDPLVTLQDRYAAGELSEEEFERKLDRVMDSTEAVEDAAREPGGASDDVTSDRREGGTRDRSETHRDELRE
ncbi:SHOCT domain-containing protein [Natronosalvus halobius]|uniref:SHOCT domain-containing protein n=1 Tax=Natronosalvus halobius TaxID=2953746 RepID=UPI0020A045A6|nr:SHOCT domain-containing protein [Natronosalvus halobius]USZ73173.1 SHOCT domain-containing protein [Natronosalvus halobius]